MVLTGDIVQLHDTLFAVKTKLGWTLQGKTTVKMFCSTDTTNFWSLETLGIRDPAETKTKQQNEEEVLATFEESVTVNNEGQ